MDFSAGAAAQEAITGSAPKKSSFFGGGGNTLGSDDAPSVAVPDRKSSPRPSGSRTPANRPRGMIRNLTFWKEGFSIEDGPLMRYDDPHNKEILEAIKAG
jgi:UBX domain-containing protein 1